MSEFDITVVFDELVSVYNCTEGDDGYTFVNADQRYLVTVLERNGEKMPAIGWVKIEHPTASLSKAAPDAVLYFALAKRIDYIDGYSIIDDHDILILRTNLHEPWPVYTAYAGNQLVYQDGLSWSGTAQELEVFIEKYASDMVNGTFPSQANRIREAAKPKNMLSVVPLDK